jgi:indolepyruvate ferredoxin oxidoreductase
MPHPVQAPLTQACGMVVAGVGGTGVITIGQLLGMAAHMEGKGIVTQDAAGLAQKGGATWSHVIIGPDQASICTTRVGMAAADLILGCDPLVAAGKDSLLRMQPGRTRVALNNSSTPTAAFVKNGNWQNPSEACVASIAQSVSPQDLGVFNADAMASTLMGDTLYVNPMILGYAWQKGWIPLDHASLMRAIELNGVAVEANKTAFAGRRRWYGAGGDVGSDR